MQFAIRSATIRVVILALCFGLYGCANHASLSLTELGAEPPSDQKPSDEPLQAGRLHFSNGDYGLAEKNFRAAVEVNPSNADAWIGLAASYDRLRRFDLAEKAYHQAVRFAGHSPAVLNNLGYHYMLRGDKLRARENLMQAAAKDPGNRRIQGNLKLLETWSNG